MKKEEVEGSVRNSLAGHLDADISQTPGDEEPRAFAHGSTQGSHLCKCDNWTQWSQGFRGEKWKTGQSKRLTQTLGHTYISGDETSGNTEAAAWETLQHCLKVVPRVVWSKGGWPKVQATLATTRKDLWADPLLVTLNRTILVRWSGLEADIWKGIIRAGREAARNGGPSRAPQAPR